MSFDQYLVFSLLVLNACQFLFWSRLVNRLENKLMSRDFHNFVDTQRPVQPKVNFKNHDDEIDLNSEIRPF